MDPFKIKSEDHSGTAAVAAAIAEQSQQRASAQIAAAFAAAKAGVGVGGALNAPAPANDASIDAILSQKMPKHLMDRALPPTIPSGPAGANQHHPVAEFLYQLTKMLTDDNSEIIEWADGRIKVHYPERLESEVLHKYFRHSKFASFQRQLNYFGFRKIAGKGKMSPCSYVNESATSDIRSLLLIKRKTNGSAARKAMAQRAMALGGNFNPALGTGLPGIAGASALGALGGAAGLSALTQQLQLQKQLGLIDTTNPLSQFLMQNQQPQSFTDLQQLGGLKPTMPSIEQLQAQLASLTKQQNQGGGASAALNAAAFNLASGGATSALGSAQLLPSDNPATAALNASASGPASMPATAAMNLNSDVQTNNLFESATNLKALIGNDQVGNDAQMAAAAAAGLNRLPSSTGMFPGTLSSASLGNLLSSNRLSSLLSLNSFLSREPSLADLAMLPSGAAQFAAFQQQQQQQQTAPGMPNDGQNA